MIDTFFNSPIPVFLSVILFSICSIPKISTKVWSKIGKSFSILLLIIFVFFKFNSKTVAGNIVYQNHLITEFTKDIEKFIEKGDCKEAEKRLNKFNQEAQFVRSNEDLKELISELSGR